MPLNRRYLSRIVPAMKTTAVLLALALGGAFPAAAQSTEFGVLFGGSSRSVDRLEGPFAPTGRDFDDNFSFSRSAVDFYYGVELEPGTLFKVKVGRIEAPVGLALEVPDAPDELIRYDVDGHVEHIDALVEYRFSEPFGSAGIHAGVGLYRQVGRRDAAVPESFDTSDMNYGFMAGVTADFPMTRRYGFILDATHHWTRLPFNPRYLTGSAGVRVRF